MQVELIEKIIHLPIAERVEIIEKISHSVSRDLSESQVEQSSQDARNDAYLRLRGIAAVEGKFRRPIKKQKKIL